MKKVILSGLVLLVLMACGKQETRYTQQSPEIETVKQLIANYNNKEYDTSLYADTAKVYYNTKNNALSPEDVMAYHSKNDANYSSRSFLAEDQEYEMVVTDRGSTWVNAWLDWEGTLAANGKTYNIPIHLAYQFVDGKIVRGVGMWDASEVALALKAIEDDKNMSVDEKMMKATANTVVEAWNSNNQELMASVMVPNFVRTENGAVLLSNAEAYGTELMAANHTAFPDFKVRMNKMTSSGNKATVYWTVMGTNTGEMNGNPPTNKKVVFPGMSVWTFNKDGKAVREDAYYDKLGMMTQMGYTLEPPK